MMKNSFNALNGVLSSLLCATAASQRILDLRARELGGLDRGGENDDAHEEEGVHLVEAAVDERRGLLTSRQQVRLTERLGEVRLHELRHGPPRGREHSQAAVLDLGLAVLLQGLQIRRTVEGVEALVADKDGRFTVGEDGIGLE